jgi:hypothetical protein
MTTCVLGAVAAPTVDKAALATLLAAISSRR